MVPIDCEKLGNRHGRRERQRLPVVGIKSLPRQKRKEPPQRLPGAGCRRADQVKPKDTGVLTDRCSIQRRRMGGGHAAIITMGIRNGDCLETRCIRNVSVVPSRKNTPAARIQTYESLSPCASRGGDGSFDSASSWRRSRFAAAFSRFLRSRSRFLNSRSRASPVVLFLFAIHPRLMSLRSVQDALLGTAPYGRRP